tara:strand:- start:12873 stop:13493 length:621 start_codon:yes stop_codon:yes gene_type:complete
MRCYCIVLNKNKERMENFYKMKNTLPNLELFSAHTPNDIQYFKNKGYIFNKSLRQTEIACLLSHVGICKKIVDENIPYAMIFEDDALFFDNFNEIIDTLEIPKDFKFIQIHIPFFKNIPELHNSNNNFSKYEPIHSTAGYIISNQMANEIYSLTKINRPIDHIYVGMADKNFYCINTCIMTALSKHPRKDRTKVREGKTLFKSTVH